MFSRERSSAGCTKTTTIKIKKAKYFSIGTDSLNKGHMKMFPVTVQYFCEENGIQKGLLDFYEDPFESSDAVAGKLLGVLQQNNLDLENVSALSADNAPVNFGKRVSVYQKLKERHAGIVKANCKCHILHNCISNALKSLTLTLKQLF